MHVLPPPKAPVGSTPGLCSGKPRLPSTLSTAPFAPQVQSKSRDLAAVGPILSPCSDRVYSRPDEAPEPHLAPVSLPQRGTVVLMARELWRQTLAFGGKGVEAGEVARRMAYAGERAR